MTSPPPPPGWYADPDQPGSWRWWNGREWSEHRSVAASSHTHSLVHNDRGLERGSARRTELAAFGRQLSSALGVLVLPVTGENLHRIYAEFVEDSHAGVSTSPVPIGLSGWLDLASLVGLVSTIFFLVWQYRAARVARGIGHRARYSPGWGVASWFVPIVCFWMPAQALADLLPRGERLRRTLWWTWAAYLVATALDVAIVVLPAAHALPPPELYQGLVALTIATDLAIGTYLAIFIRGVELDHAAALGEG